MYNKPRISEILFATDLSDNATQALDYAVSLAESFGARITVLHVVEKIPPNTEMLMTAMLGYENIDEYRQKSEVELIGRIKERIKRLCEVISGQIAAECHPIFKNVLVEPGNAFERILHHTETGSYDVLVMGSRGLGLLQEAFMGGTSRKVLRSCPVPIFLIPLRFTSSNAA